jgi:hypothetical protein
MIRTVLRGPMVSRGATVLCGVLAAVPAILGIAPGCAGTPDLAREEKQAGESHSPAEQFRIMSSGKFLTGDYFVERGEVEGLALLDKGTEQEKKTEDLSQRVQRLEQHAQGKEEVPPQLKPNSSSGKPQASDGSDAVEVKSRLRLLMDLKQEGLITDEEYREKRQEILKGI